MIDLPTINEPGALKRVRAALDAAINATQGSSRAGFSKSGLFCFSMPQGEQSLQERFTESSNEAPVAGRRFKTSFLAVTAVSKLEHALRKNPRARFRLLAGQAVADYFNSCPQWFERLSERYGARFEVECDRAKKERDYDLCEQ